ncbi:MAG: alcohol dehydrogenase catalytic domain-containing protein [Proteobacteria bacterium]|nr:alcohol dehydrogenase catalytic domain-containing protein [Pseudomonadota bacterium]
MILTGPRTLVAGKIDKPAPGDGEVLVRMTHSGICGTDLKIYSGGIPVDYPRIMGHEMIGEIVETTQGGPAIGARVIVDPVLYCGTCYQCREGQINICPDGALIGRDCDGGFADFMAVPKANVYVLPDGIGNKEASLIQVLTTCVHAHDIGPVKPGEAVVVIGLGVTGQLHVQLAKAAGAGIVIGVTRSAWKRELAETLGADATVAPGDDLEQQILDLTEGRGADLVIECAGQIPTLAQSINLARIGGRILNFGTYTAKEGALPFYQLYFKELVIFNPRAAKAGDFQPSIDLVKSGAVKLLPLISHEMPLDDLSKALETLESGTIDTMKVILRH